MRRDNKHDRIAAKNNIVTMLVIDKVKESDISETDGRRRTNYIHLGGVGGCYCGGWGT